MHISRLRKRGIGIPSYDHSNVSVRIRQKERKRITIPPSTRITRLLYKRVTIGRIAILINLYVHVGNFHLAVARLSERSQRRSQSREPYVCIRPNMRTTDDAANSLMHIDVFEVGCTKEKRPRPLFGHHPGLVPAKVHSARPRQRWALPTAMCHRWMPYKYLWGSQIANKRSFPSAL